MFNYVGDISALAQNIIKEYCSEKIVAVDATLGNGYDTDFLSDNFLRVYSMDIQKKLVDAYMKKEKEQVVLLCDTHDKLDQYVKEEINCAMYNLGYCPGEDKEITTMAQSTLVSIKKALSLLKSGGIITIAIYVGHDEGKNEKSVILDYLRTLPKDTYGVMLHEYINRSAISPKLAVIEKK
ncbi:tRNA (mnm(5)s(2)U34)-methyltransferase [Alloiococcus sp. CFN-8]|uniref:tRNA (mnm(5)s(2)U34)-methyltransferase n=1 Tax=Alloiococcus sp. CFN-8 TaxID=3416081 RepID=UPI003CE9B011